MTVPPKSVQAMLPSNGRWATAQCQLASQSASVLCHSLRQGLVSGSTKSPLAPIGMRLAAAVEKSPNQHHTGLDLSRRLG